MTLTADALSRRERKDASYVDVRKKLCPLVGSLPELLTNLPTVVTELLAALEASGTSRGVRYRSVCPVLETVVKDVQAEVLPELGRILAALMGCLSGADMNVAEPVLSAWKNLVGSLYAPLIRDMPAFAPLLGPWLLFEPASHQIEIIEGLRPVLRRSVGLNRFDQVLNALMEVIVMSGVESAVRPLAGLCFETVRNVCGAISAHQLDVVEDYLFEIDSMPWLAQIPPLQRHRFACDVLRWFYRLVRYDTSQTKAVDPTGNRTPTRYQERVENGLLQRLPEDEVEGLPIELCLLWNHWPPVIKSETLPLRLDSLVEMSASSLAAHFALSTLLVQHNSRLTLDDKISCKVPATDSVQPGWIFDFCLQVADGVQPGLYHGDELIRSCLTSCPEPLLPWIALRLQHQASPGLVLFLKSRMEGLDLAAVQKSVHCEYPIHGPLLAPSLSDPCTELACTSQVCDAEWGLAGLFAALRWLGVSRADARELALSRSQEILTSIHTASLLRAYLFKQSTLYSGVEINSTLLIETAFSMKDQDVAAVLLSLVVKSDSNLLYEAVGSDHMGVRLQALRLLAAAGSTLWEVALEIERTPNDLQAAGGKKLSLFNFVEQASKLEPGPVLDASMIFVVAQASTKFAPVMDAMVEAMGMMAGSGRASKRRKKASGAVLAAPPHAVEAAVRAVIARMQTFTISAPSPKPTFVHESAARAEGTDAKALFTRLAKEPVAAMVPEQFPALRSTHAVFEEQVEDLELRAFRAQPQTDAITQFKCLCRGVSLLLEPCGALTDIVFDVVRERLDAYVKNRHYHNEVTLAAILEACATMPCSDATQRICQRICQTIEEEVCQSTLQALRTAAVDFLISRNPHIKLYAGFFSQLARKENIPALLTRNSLGVSGFLSDDHRYLLPIILRLLVGVLLSTKQTSVQLAVYRAIADVECEYIAVFIGQCLAPFFGHERTVVNILAQATSETFWVTIGDSSLNSVPVDMWPRGADRNTIALHFSTLTGLKSLLSSCRKNLERFVPFVLGFLCCCSRQLKLSPFPEPGRAQSNAAKQINVCWDIVQMLCRDHHDKFNVLLLPGLQAMQPQIEDLADKLLTGRASKALTFVETMACDAGSLQFFDSVGSSLLTKLFQGMTGPGMEHSVSVDREMCPAFMKSVICVALRLCGVSEEGDPVDEDSWHLLRPHVPLLLQQLLSIFSWRQRHEIYSSRSGKSIPTRQELELIGYIWESLKDEDLSALGCIGLQLVRLMTDTLPKNPRASVWVVRQNLTIMDKSLFNLLIPSTSLDWFQVQLLPFVGTVPDIELRCTLCRLLLKAHLISEGHANAVALVDSLSDSCSALQKEAGEGTSMVAEFQHLLEGLPFDAPVLTALLSMNHVVGLDDSPDLAHGALGYLTSVVQKGGFFDEHSAQLIVQQMVYYVGVREFDFGLSVAVYDLLTAWIGRVQNMASAKSVGQECDSRETQQAAVIVATFAEVLIPCLSSVLRAGSDETKRLSMKMLRLLVCSWHPLASFLPTTGDVICSLSLDLALVEDPEFFEDVMALSLHVRATQLKAVAKQVDSGLFCQPTLARFLAPLGLHAALQLKAFEVTQAYRAAGIILMSSVTRQSSWRFVVKTAVHLLDQITKEPQLHLRLVSVLCALLSAVEFEKFDVKVSELSPEEVGELIERQREATARQDDAEEDEEKDEEESEEQDEDLPAEGRVTGIDGIHQDIRHELLPRLNKLLYKKGKTGKKRLTAVRPEVAAACLLLIRRLPKEEFHRRLTPLFHATSVGLRNKIESSRAISRKAVVHMAMQLGPRYLAWVIALLRGVLRDGYQQPVLVYSVHCILYKFSDSHLADEDIEEELGDLSEPQFDFRGCVDDILEQVMPILAAEIRRTEDPDLPEGFKWSTREGRASRAAQLVQILTAVLSPKKACNDVYFFLYGLLTGAKVELLGERRAFSTKLLNKVSALFNAASDGLKFNRRVTLVDRVRVARGLYALADEIYDESTARVQRITHRKGPKLMELADSGALQSLDTGVADFQFLSELRKLDSVESNLPDASSGRSVASKRKDAYVVLQPGASAGRKVSDYVKRARGFDPSQRACTVATAASHLMKGTFLRNHPLRLRDVDDEEESDDDDEDSLDPDALRQELNGTCASMVRLLCSTLSDLFAPVANNLVRMLPLDVAALDAYGPVIAVAVLNMVELLGAAGSSGGLLRVSTKILSILIRRNRGSEWLDSALLSKALVTDADVRRHYTKLEQQPDAEETRTAALKCVRRTFKGALIGQAAMGLEVPALVSTSLGLLRLLLFNVIRPDTLEAETAELLYSAMDAVARIVVKGSAADSKVARKCFTEFVLAYPMAPKAKKERIQYLLDNLYYDVDVGRRHALLCLGDVMQGLAYEELDHNYSRLFALKAGHRLSVEHDTQLVVSLQQFMLALFERLGAKVVQRELYPLVTKLFMGHKEPGRRGLLRMLTVFVRCLGSNAVEDATSLTILSCVWPSSSQAFVEEDVVTATEAALRSGGDQVACMEFGSSRLSMVDAMISLVSELAKSASEALEKTSLKVSTLRRSACHGTWTSAFNFQEKVDFHVPSEALLLVWQWCIRHVMDVDTELSLITRSAFCESLAELLDSSRTKANLQTPSAEAMPLVCASLCDPGYSVKSFPEYLLVALSRSVKSASLEASSGLWTACHRPVLAALLRCLVESNFHTHDVEGDFVTRSGVLWLVSKTVHWGCKFSFDHSNVFIRLCCVADLVTQVISTEGMLHDASPLLPHIVRLCLTLQAKAPTHVELVRSQRRGLQLNSTVDLWKQLPRLDAFERRQFLSTLGQNCQRDLEKAVGSPTVSKHISAIKRLRTKTKLQKATARKQLEILDPEAAAKEKRKIALNRRKRRRVVQS